MHLTETNNALHAAKTQGPEKSHSGHTTIHVHCATLGDLIAVHCSPSTTLTQSLQLPPGAHPTTAIALSDSLPISIMSGPANSCRR